MGRGEWLIHRGGCLLIYGVLRYTDEFLLSTYNFKVASYNLQGIKPVTLVKLGKICQTFFFFLQVYEVRKISVPVLFLTTLKVALVASTL